jgi:hypothetical protein
MAMVRAGLIVAGAVGVLYALVVLVFAARLAVTRQGREGHYGGEILGFAVIVVLGFVGGALQVLLAE